MKRKTKELIEERIIGLIEEARQLCQEYSINWLEMVEQSKI